MHLCSRVPRPCAVFEALCKLMNIYTVDKRRDRICVALFPGPVRSRLLYKFCTNFVLLQVTNAQGLGTRLALVHLCVTEFGPLLF